MKSFYFSSSSTGLPEANFKEGSEKKVLFISSSYAFDEIDKIVRAKDIKGFSHNRGLMVDSSASELPGHAELDSAISEHGCLYSHSDSRNVVRLSTSISFSGPPLNDEIEGAKATLYAYERSGSGKMASFFAVFFIEMSFNSKNYSNVNKLLSQIDIDLLTEWSMVALLRSSYSARHFLPAWKILYSEAKSKLDRDGKNSRSFLRGLNR